MKKITEEQLEEMYDEMLDSEGEVKVCGMSFCASRILKELDSIAYDCGMADYADSLMSDGYFVEGYSE